jgi:hypothetical protein
VIPVVFPFKFALDPFFGLLLDAVVEYIIHVSLRLELTVVIVKLVKREPFISDGVESFAIRVFIHGFIPDSAETYMV